MTRKDHCSLGSTRPETSRLTILLSIEKQTKRTVVEEILGQFVQQKFLRISLRHQLPTKPQNAPRYAILILYITVHPNHTAL